MTKEQHRHNQLADPGAQIHATGNMNEASREDAGDISGEHRIYCNRQLPMESLRLIGFDMDYTIAPYNQEELGKLCIELTIKKLIEQENYPEAIRNLTYDQSLAVRGLVIDRRLGNVFKLDEEGHVGRAMHGFRRLTEKECRRIYHHRRIRLRLPRYHWVDTLFSLPEVVLYLVLVDYFDKCSERPSYDRLFRDIESCLDRSHQDETLKSRVCADLDKYIRKDPELPGMLFKLRSSGKKLFLLTNSLFTYTNSLMSYIFQDTAEGDLSWMDYFDAVIVGAKKPDFFSKRNPFKKLDIETGKDIPLDQSDSSPILYEEGNIRDFEAIMGFRGDEVLYVGDHIYSDVLRLKKTNIWHTAMVIQELDEEISLIERLHSQFRYLDYLERKERTLSADIDYNRLLSKSSVAIDKEQAFHEESEQLQIVFDKVVQEAQKLRARIDAHFNLCWGSIFREGTKNSYFSGQLSSYADVYTSTVSNFSSYSPLRCFHAPRFKMPHEK